MRISDWSSDVCSSDLEVSGDFDGDGVEEERYELSANRYEIGASSAYKFDPRNYVVGSARYENDDFSPYDYHAIASSRYGPKFFESALTRLCPVLAPFFLPSPLPVTLSFVHFFFLLPLFSFILPLSLLPPFSLSFLFFFFFFSFIF